MRDGMYVVKSWQQMEKEYGLSEFENIKTRLSWLSTMEKKCPIHRHIEVVNDKWGTWNISKEMLLGPAFKIGETVQVRDHKDGVWASRGFYGYSFSPTESRKVLSINGSFRYIKWPEEKPKMRAMTRNEVLGFVANTPCLLCRYDDHPGTRTEFAYGYTFNDPIERYKWATISMHGKISEWHEFEVEDTG